MAVNNQKAKLHAGEAEVAREARRIFRQLATPNAHLAQVNSDWYALHHGARMERRVQKIAAPMVDRFFDNGWLARGEKRGTFVLSGTGVGWLAREEASDGDPFLAQHQIRSIHTIADPVTKLPAAVLVNEAEDPLGYLLHRRVITKTQYDAGEKLRRDYTFAKLAPKLTADLSLPRVDTSKASAVVPDLALAAGQRFRIALRALGPGLSDIVFDICCDLKGLEDCERSRDWPRRSAKVVLCMALDRLADHYGLATQGPAHARVRAWSME